MDAGRPSRRRARDSVSLRPNAVRCMYQIPHGVIGSRIPVFLEERQYRTAQNVQLLKIPCRTFRGLEGEFRSHEICGWQKFPNSSSKVQNPQLFGG